MLRVLVELVGLPQLDDAAEVHDGDAVGDVADDAEVVRDEEVGQVEVAAGGSCSRLRICAWIETSSADTGSSQTISFGRQRERARDADALPLAARELVRIAVVVLRVEADAVHQLLHRAADVALGLVDRERARR